MNVNFDALEQIPKILELLKQLLDTKNNQVEKRWLSTKETAEYLGYSKDAIDSKVKSNEFLAGTHYHQRASKRMFDKSVLDKWVIGIDMIDVCANSNINATIKHITDQFVA
ncbi:helix-turn-helix transcriptional regulator [Candidatus Sulfurimonas baltica]|uniref:Helix-turn-helix domain-containing protein n=1 Tax=Candidatus Sulfurimonas baltica TaxID=2740404 RepID=A0A7S7LXA3_9BACT|nr:helix-turn-helix domain-containing protein [Candidatus Sulfurimonas baltica]QOY52294.1 helix-turn-helix domain-containing protein [Candidatus Sulfurimonas baltica]